METENQSLYEQLSHRSERCKLYKQELAITKENQFNNLAKYRNDIYREICKVYEIPSSNFPSLSEQVRKVIPSPKIAI